MTVPSATALVAIDWGTTSARAWRLDANGTVLDRRDAACGVQAVEGGDFKSALSRLLGDWNAIAAPRIACGMIGSRQGWVEVPYLECPARPASLAQSLMHTPGRELAIVAGLACRDEAGVADVMRGEETQIAGLPDDALQHSVVVQPGTHSKWTLLRGGELTAFRTYMTGETFSLLRNGSILGRLMTAGDDPEAFEDGVRHALDMAAPGELLHRIFAARTRVLFGEMAAASASDFLSGLLIGSEVAAGLAWASAHAPARIRLVGESALCHRYEDALRLAGHESIIAPASTAAQGLWKIAQLAGLLDSRAECAPESSC
jgi:2-dehydro-3-deoxygalactonokinase